ncbi:AAA family ATPase [Clostridium tyrobutyricum]|uniref:AAA family ATPase n=1 Tax=Clostridium tyrobutyricum TaxID=1519 RepID=UPI001C3812E8|nr:AAA family ATPase [Clostridium tyrobutyricum]MBV4420182.1 AAA family ATPase [Clostridium tyrobutyricum]
MRLKKVKIKNFRSFHHEKIIDTENFTVIIGANSSGKTTFFNAILKLFGESNAEREIKRSDFNVPFNQDPNSITENDFSIETVFEFNEVKKDNGIEKYTVPPYFENFIIEDKESCPYIRIRLDAKWHKSNQPEGIIDSEVYFITVPEGKKIKAEDKKPIDKLKLSLIKVIYVPAIRDPHIQLKNVAGTILWRLFNGININDAFKSNINDKLDKVNEEIGKQEGISELKSIMAEQWLKYDNDTRYNELSLEYNSSDIESILSKIDVKFSPTETGNSYKVDDLGDGLRSLFYFTLVGSLLKAEYETLKEIITNPEKCVDDRIFSFEPPCLTIIAVEEPENHIAPHLLGKVMSNLRDTSNNSNCQIILSSHTPAIVKRVEPEEIRHFRNCKDELCTVVNKIVLPPETDIAYKYVKEGVRAYPEIYFSSLVVLGEGDSEEVILPKVLDTVDIEINTNEIAIVPLGGRHVNYFWKLLEQLKIPYVTLLDLDLEREGGGWGRIKYVIKQLIENGYDKKELSKIRADKVLTDVELENMHTWPIESETDREILFSCAKFLEKYNVFFSSPLDIDFLMINEFKHEYIQTLRDGQGPVVKINSKNKKILDLKKEDLEKEEYKEKVKDAVGYALKDKNKKGICYSEESRELMVWYNYFFLGRGKPLIHRLAVTLISKDKFKNNLPDVFVNLCQSIKKQLNI